MLKLNIKSALALFFLFTKNALTIDADPKKESDNQTSSKTLDLTTLDRQIWDYNIKETVRDMIEQREKLDKLAILGPEIQIDISKTKFNDVYSVVSKIGQNDPKTVLTRGKTVADTVIESVGQSKLTMIDTKNITPEPNTNVKQEVTKSSAVIEEIKKEPKPEQIAEKIPASAPIEAIAEKEAPLSPATQPEVVPSNLENAQNKDETASMVKRLMFYAATAAIIVIACKLILRSKINIEITGNKN